MLYKVMPELLLRFELEITFIVPPDNVTFPNIIYQLVETCVACMNSTLDSENPDRQNTLYPQHYLFSTDVSL